MLYLLIAILFSTLVSVFMRFSEGYRKNKMLMFFSNYVTCSAIGACFLGGRPLFPSGEGMGFALGLGIASGALYLICLELMQLNISRSGVMLTSVFNKLGVLVPIVLAVTVFGEKPELFQILGFCLAVAAILVINLEPGAARTRSTGSILLLTMLVVGGFTDAVVSIYEKTGVPAWRDHFLLYIFFFAGIFALVVGLIRRGSFGWADILFGVLVGVPNYFSSRFLMLSLPTVPAVVAYPVYNVGTIVLISISGILLFHEKLTIRKAIGIGLILCALVLLNL